MFTSSQNNLDEPLLLVGTSISNGKKNSETQCTAQVPQGKEGS